MNRESFRLKAGRSVKNRSEAYYNDEVSTIDRMMDHFKRDDSSIKITESEFNINRPENQKTITDALNWISTTSDDSEYIHNLKVISSFKYIDIKHLGILISLFPAYYRHLEQVKKQEELSAQKLQSQYIGEIGERITIEVKDWRCVTSFDNQWGTTFLYKFTDYNDNIFIWYASSSITIDRNHKLTSITGKVKEHSIYREVKQTVLTRCKYTQVEVQSNDAHEPSTWDDSILDIFEA